MGLLAAINLYFFDIGVAGSLQERGKIKEKSPQFGDAFACYIHHELRTYIHYRSQKSLHYWRSTSHFEVDFIYDNRFAIEVKGKRQLSANDLKGLKAIKEENLLEGYIIVYMGGVMKTLEDGIQVVPWQTFLGQLWQGIYD